MAIDNSVTKHVSKGDWEMALSKSGNCLVIDSGSESPSEFVTIKFPQLLVGIIIEDSGLSPKIGPYSPDEYLICADNRVVRLSASNKSIVQTLDFASYVVDAFKTGGTDIVVIEEIGVGRFTPQGEKVWYQSTDLITDFQVNEKTICLQTDSGSISLQLSTGAKE